MGRNSIPGQQLAHSLLIFFNQTAEGWPWHEMLLVQILSEMNEAFAGWVDFRRGQRLFPKNI